MVSRCGAQFHFRVFLFRCQLSYSDFRCVAVQSLEVLYRHAAPILSPISQDFDGGLSVASPFDSCVFRLRDSNSASVTINMVDSGLIVTLLFCTLFSYCLPFIWSRRRCVALFRSRFSFWQFLSVQSMEVLRRLFDLTTLSLVTVTPYPLTVRYWRISGYVWKDCSLHFPVAELFSWHTLIEFETIRHVYFSMGSLFQSHFSEQRKQHVRSHVHFPSDFWNVLHRREYLSCIDWLSNCSWACDPVDDPVLYDAFLTVLDSIW